MFGQDYMFDESGKMVAAKKMRLEELAIEVVRILTQLAEAVERLEARLEKRNVDDER